MSSYPDTAIQKTASAPEDLLHESDRPREVRDSVVEAAVFDAERGMAPFAEDHRLVGAHRQQEDGRGVRRLGRRLRILGLSHGAGERNREPGQQQQRETGQDEAEF